MTYGLTPRPGVAPDELAAIVAGVQAIVGEVTPVVVDEVPVWRFSGRWFNDGRFAHRRPHSVN